MPHRLTSALTRSGPRDGHLIGLFAAHHGRDSVASRRFLWTCTMSAVGRKTGRSRTKTDGPDKPAARQSRAPKEPELWFHCGYMMRAALSSAVVAPAMSHLMYAQARLCAPVLGDTSAQLLHLPICAIALGSLLAHRYRKLSWRAALRSTSLFLALHLLYISVIVSIWRRPAILVQNVPLLLALSSASCASCASHVSKEESRVEESLANDALLRSGAIDKASSSALSQPASTTVLAGVLGGDASQSPLSRTSSTRWIISFRLCRR